MIDPFPQIVVKTGTNEMTNWCETSEDSLLHFVQCWVTKKQKKNTKELNCLMSTVVLNMSPLKVKVDTWSMAADSINLEQVGYKPTRSTKKLVVVKRGYLATNLGMKH